MANSNVLNRAFTFREKVLLVILALVFLGGVYYLAIVRGTTDTMESNARELATVQQQIKTGKTILAQRQAMKKELDALGSTESLPQVAVYNNITAETEQLNSLLADASVYNVSYGEPMVSDTLVRRAVTANFTMATVDEVEAVVKAIDKGPWATSLTSFTYTTNYNTDGSVKNVSATLDVTYFETTSGSKDLSGLVEDTETQASSNHISAAEVSAAFLSGSAPGSK